MHSVGTYGVPTVRVYKEIVVKHKEGNSGFKELSHAFLLILIQIIFNFLIKILNIHYFENTVLYLSSQTGLLK